MASLFRLQGVSPKEVAKRTWAEIRADEVFGRSAQLAYYFFLALFPFLICVIASLSVFGSADRGRAILFGLFARFLPAPAFQLVSNTFDEILHASGPLKMSFGIVVSVWSASMGMGAVMDTLNAAYKVKETRSLIKQYSVAIGLTVGLTVLLVISIVMAIVGDRLVAEFPAGNSAAIIWRMTLWVFSVAVLLLVFAITYYYAPDLKSRSWHWISPGSIAGMVLLIGVSFGLRAYIRYWGSYTLTYGSLGAVIILLLTFYLSGVAVLSGGALNGVLQNLVPAKKAVERGAADRSVELSPR